MSSLAKVDSNTGLSDFSDNLLNVTAGNTYNKKSSSQIKGTKSNNKNKITENCNLSSVLSRIQDEGPAADENIKISSDQTTDHIETSSAAYRDLEEEYSKVNDTSHLLSDKLVVDKFSQAKALKRIVPNQIVLLIILSFLFIGLAMYKLDLHVKNSIEQTILSVNENYAALNHNHQIPMGERVLKNNSDVVVLTEEIKALRIELEQVKNSIKSSVAISMNSKSVDTEPLATKLLDTSSHEVENNEFFEPINIPGNNIKEDETIALVNTKVEEDNAKTNASLKNNMIVRVDDNIIETNNTNKLIKRKEMLKKNINKNQDKKLIVNLVVLSNQDKANKIVSNLELSDVVPAIEEIVVNNKILHKITVSGFSTLDDAKSFVNSAEKKYGVKDSRVRGH